MTPYEALAELARRELELVSAGELEELDALQRERSALVEMLPETPPPAARPSLEHAAGLQTRTSAALAERLREAGAELRHLGRGRTAMAGYTPPHERVKLVDRAG